MRDIFVAWICISFILFSLVLTGQSVAKIDLETVVAMWLFDEGKGDVAKDSSGNGLDGEFVKAPKWVDGKFGKALEFNGADNYVKVPEFTSPSKAITVTAWAKSPTPTWNNYGWIVERRPSFILHPNQGEKTVAWCVGNGGWNVPHGWKAGATGPDDITKWHMYTGTYDSSTGEWKLYIDGEPKNTLSCNKVEITATPGPLHIGLDSCCGMRFGSGTVDEVAIFNVALSEDDIKEIYTKGLTGITAVSPGGKLSTTWGNIKAR
jgi:hypothetical protein